VYGRLSTLRFALQVKVHHLGGKVENVAAVLALHGDEWSRVSVGARDVRDVGGNAKVRRAAHRTRGRGTARVQVARHVFLLFRG
jgi:hypothetical protein